jgi:hypothetical protein
MMRGARLICGGLACVGPLLWVTSARATEPGDAGTRTGNQAAVEVLVEVAATPSVAGAGTDLDVAYGVRGFWPLGGAPVGFWGVDVAALAAFARDGGERIAVSESLLFLEPRLLWGATLPLGFAEWRLYLFGGPHVGGGVRTYFSDAEPQIRALARWGGRLGVGHGVRFGDGWLRMELGGGIRDGRPEVLSTLGLGWWY